MRILMLASMLAPATLGAQASIRGTLFDSLRINGPVANAEVVLLGGGLRARTDANGRFDFVDVPAGRHAVAFWSPWLDSLALPPMQQEVEVTSGRSTIVHLATPSPATYQRAACGTTLESEQGVLVGEIRGADGAPLPGIGVSTRWSETLIGIGRFERRLVAAVDTSNAAGLYAVCGVPVGSEIALRAIGRERVGSNEIVLSITSRVQRRDLVIGPADLRSRITGRIVRPDGTALAAASVAVTGDSSLIVQADDEGRFVLENVPRRSTQLVARALGHMPAFATVELVDPDVDIDDIRLDRLPHELSTVTVSGEPITAARAQFETRKSRGLGSFIGDAELARYPNRTSNVIVTMVPRAYVQQTRQGPMLLLRRGSEMCRPRFFVDGYDNGDLSASEEGSLMAQAKRIEIYTANDTPPQFNDFDGCGAVVVWTR
jgi:hypothetical protein